VVKASVTVALWQDTGKPEKGEHGRRGMKHFLTDRTAYPSLDESIPGNALINAES
jgi:hypothetical protein